MPANDRCSGLLALPWEVRSVILIDVLKHSRTKEPVFDRKLVKNRVRVRNLFDTDFPQDTNIYIQSAKRRYFHGDGLIVTCRQLRRDITLLVNEEFKTGRIDIPFALDVMFVKDIGIFPTWMSFPYRTKRILNLRVNIRIVRPEPHLIPNEWIEKGRYKSDHWRSFRSSAAEWNLLHVVSLYALGRLSFRSTYNSIPLEACNQQPDIPTDCKQYRGQTGTERDIKNGVFRHKSPVVDAHLVPFESTPYVVDDLCLDFHRYEYDALGNTIEPTAKDAAHRETLGQFWFLSENAISPRLEDKAKDSLFYREGFVQFGRNVFTDMHMMYHDCMSDCELNAELGASGSLATYLLEEYFLNGFDPITFSYYDCRFAVCYHVLVNTVGEVTWSSAVNGPQTLQYKNTDAWVRRWNDDLDPFHSGKIKREIAEEEAKENPDTEQLARMRTARRRIALGWQAQYDEWYKTEHE